MKIKIHTPITIIITIMYVTFCIQSNIYAQNNKIVSFNSKILKRYQRDGHDINKLIGKVTFVKKGLIITCDEAEYEEQKKIVAKGNIIIVKTRKDGSIIKIYSDSLHYYVDKEIAEFLHGVKLREGENTLTSDIGRYNDAEDTANFHSNVKIINSEQNISCDVLSYETVNEEITHDHFELFQITPTINIDHREFVGNNNSSQFNKNKYRKHFKKKIYLAEGNVNIIIKKEQIQIKSDFFVYLKKEEKLKLYGNPILKKSLKKDDFYIYSDKIIIQQDETATLKTTKRKKKNKNRMNAYGNVCLFSKEFKAKSNQIEYLPSKNIVLFGINSILWTKDSQLTANNAKLFLEDDNLKEMRLKDRAFIIQNDIYKNYNQIKGEDIVMTLKNNKVDTMVVSKNAQSIQYISDEKDKKLIGINHINAQKIKIKFKNDKAIKVAIYGQTYDDSLKGLAIAPKNMNPQNSKFQGFNWRPEDKPTFEEVKALMNDRR